MGCMLPYKCCIEFTDKKRKKQNIVNGVAAPCVTGVL